MSRLFRTIHRIHPHPSTDTSNDNHDHACQSAPNHTISIHNIILRRLFASSTLLFSPAILSPWPQQLSLNSRPPWSFALTAASPLPEMNICKGTFSPVRSSSSSSSSSPSPLTSPRHQREALQMLHLPHVLRPAVSIPPRRTTLRRPRARRRLRFRLEPQELIVTLLGISCSAITPSTAETTTTKKACRQTME